MVRIDNQSLFNTQTPSREMPDFIGSARTDFAGGLFVHRYAAPFLHGYPVELSPNRHTHCRPSRLTFTAPIERSARACLEIWIAVGLPPA